MWIFGVYLMYQDKEGNTMTRYGDEILLEECEELWDNIVGYMDDEVE